MHAATNDEIEISSLVALFPSSYARCFRDGDGGPDGKTFRIL
jgi:hypothetical protein